MYMAAFGDVHGNGPALAAVLADIDALGILTVVHTGDLVVGHPQANEVIAAVRDRAIPGVQGEWDRLVVRATRKGESLRQRLPEDEWEVLQETYRTTHSAAIEYLRGLPKVRRITVDGIDIFLCHGTPASPAETLDADEPPMRFQRMRETANTPIVICGRTHKAYAREVDGTLFVNPGTAGLAREAQYAVINTETRPWRAEFRSVPYEP